MVREEPRLRVRSVYKEPQLVVATLAYIAKKVMAWGAVAAHKLRNCVLQACLGAWFILTAVEAIKRFVGVTAHQAAARSAASTWLTSFHGSSWCIFATLFKVGSVSIM